MEAAVKVPESVKRRPDNLYLKDHPDPSYCPIFTDLEHMRRDYDRFAQHLALGLTLEQAARLRGVGIRTAKAIINHPLFQELLEAKKIEVTQIRAEVAHDMIKTGAKGFKKLEEMLDSGKLSFGDTLKVTAFCFDRDPEAQFAKNSKKKTEHRHVWDGSMIEQLKANAALAGLETVDVEVLEDQSQTEGGNRLVAAETDPEAASTPENPGETASSTPEIDSEAGNPGDDSDSGAGGDSDEAHQ